MIRAGLIALAATSALTAGPVQAQQICCVPPQPAYGPQPQYGPPPQYQYPPQTRPDGMRGYAEPEYPDRPAPLGLRGYIGAQYGSTHDNSTSPRTKTETWSGEAAASGRAGGFGVQGDIKVANVDGPGGDSWVVSPTLHAYKRNPYGLIGGWAGWAHSGGADLFGIGAEGQAYMSNATLYGSVGYGRVSDAVDQNLWAARVEGRYFVTENFRLDARAGLMRVSDRGSSARSTVRTVGFGAEFQPNNVPFSVNAGYSHADVSNSTLESDTIRVGVRWNFDGGTLAERDRLGATLNNITDLLPAQ